MLTKKIVYNFIKRQVSTKRKFPLSDEYLKSLPVFDYNSPSKERNRVYAWGSMKDGALGADYIKNKRLISTLRYPKRLGFGERNEVVLATCGFGFTAFAINNSDEYKVYGTGLNTDSQIGCHEHHKKPLEVIFFPQPIYIPFHNHRNVKVKRISAGRAHLAVLSTEGLHLLGNNAYGQCGRKVVKNELYFKNQTITHIRYIEGKLICDVVCGQDHTIVITEDGAVYSCGWGADGQTGLGHYDSISNFTRVEGDIKNEKITKVSCRSDFVLALNDKGEVFGWGNTEYGQITTIDDRQQICTPIFLKSCQKLGKIKDVASGGSFCMVLNDESDVYVWGFGILGVGPLVQQSTVPIQIPPQLFGLNDFNPNNYVTAVRCGLSHLAAITTEGDLYIWGRNREYCLGLGTMKDQLFPLKVAIGGKVKDISCGFDHNVAICGAFMSNSK